MADSQKGMTIVEVAVGVALTLILGGALVSMGILALRVSNQARMKAKALRYAEEGIEVARRTRDSISFFSLEDLFSECEGTKCCVREGRLSSCTPPESLEDGIFERMITITREEEGKRAHITVKVSWGRDKEVRLETFLTAWRE